MSEEVEIRVFLDNPEKATQKIKKRADMVDEIDQEDMYFTPQDEDYFQKEPVRKYLRIRQRKDKKGQGGELGFHLCHFEDNGSLLYVDEYETEVGDSKTTKEILNKLGIEVKVVVRKHRKVFDYKGFELVLDHIEDLGHFLEVEAKDVEGSAREKKEKCFEVLESFDLEFSEAPDEGYPDMLLKKKD